MRKIIAFVLAVACMTGAVYATDSKEEVPQPEGVTIIKKVGIYKGCKYKVRLSSIRKKYRKKITKKTVPAYVNYKGERYKVVGIGKNAFKDCKKIKKIYIKSKKAISVAKKAIPPNATVYLKARGKQYKLMKKNLRRSGFKGKIKKY